VDYIDMPPIPPHLREPLRAALRGERVEWPALREDEVRTLVVHGVAPIVYDVAGVPELRAEAIRAAAAETRVREDLVEILRALGENVLVIKGSALAYDLYARPELRPRGDTDLLISVKDLQRVREIMRGLGAEEIPASGDEHGLRQIVFVRNGQAYDIHWAVTNTPVFADVVRFDQVRAKRIEALGANGLDDVDALLLACIHRVAHHHDSDRLIWLADIALLRKRMSEDEHRAFWRAAAERGVVGVCRRSIELAGEWFGASGHRAEDYLTREELDRNEAASAFLDRSITHGGVMLANFKALPWRARIERLWHLAFPPPSFMRETFGVRNAVTLPWWYVVRGVRGVGRLFRRVAS
jgi:hypothetical protein